METFALSVKAPKSPGQKLVKVTLKGYPGVVLERFLRFPETTQDLFFNNGYAPFQLQGFTRHTQRAE